MKGKEDWREEFGETIRALRKSIRMKRQELADKVGVSISTVAQWERGERTPMLENVFLMAEVLGVAPFELFGEYTVKTYTEIFNFRLQQAEKVFRAMFDSEEPATITVFDDSRVAFELPPIQTSLFPDKSKMVYLPRADFVHMIENAVMTAAKTGEGIKSVFYSYFEK